MNFVPVSHEIYNGGESQLAQLCQPLDYSGLPFRCFRCHAHGHLANAYSLPFNKKSFSVTGNKIWKAKNCELEANLETKKVKVLEEITKDLNIPHLSGEGSVIESLSSLTNLKPLCLNSMTEGLGMSLTVNDSMGLFRMVP